MGNKIGPIIIGIILFGILIFFAFREVFCWYWKVNKQIEYQDKMLQVMLRILEEMKKNN